MKWIFKHATKSHKYTVDHKRNRKQKKKDGGVVNVKPFCIVSTIARGKMSMEETKSSAKKVVGYNVPKRRKPRKKGKRAKRKKSRKG